MRRLSIAVIDDGIHPDVLEKLTGQYKEINRLQMLNGNCVKQYAQPLETINHGTICTALLIEFLERYELLDLVDITSLSIVNSEKEQTISALFDALKWCAGHRVDLVLMSIGAKSFIYASKLLPAIERAKSHLTMVAATANDYSITYPACFRDVIGVKNIRYTDEVRDIINVIQSPHDGIEIEAWISDSYVLNNCEKLYSIEYPKSNSLMVPFAASQLSRILLENGHVEKNGLLEILSSKHQLRKSRLMSPGLSSDLPIVLALYRAEKGWNICEILSSIVQMFMNDEYSCACLTDFCKESIFEKSIYYLPSNNGCEWMEYYRKALDFNSFILVMIDEDNHVISDIDADLVISAKDNSIVEPTVFVKEIYELVIVNMTLME